MDTGPIENLYVLENELENISKIRLRALTQMEICLLISMHLQYENDKKAYEMKINYNSSIFAHKFKSKSEKIVNQKLIWENMLKEQKFIIVNQIIDNSKEGEQSEEEYSDFEDGQNKQIFKQFVVQITKKKVNESNCYKASRQCYWPACLKNAMREFGVGQNSAASEELIKKEQVGSRNKVTNIVGST